MKRKIPRLSLQFPKNLQINGKSFFLENTNQTELPQYLCEVIPPPQSNFLFKNNIDFKLFGIACSSFAWSNKLKEVIKVFSRTISTLNFLVLSAALLLSQQVKKKLSRPIATFLHSLYNTRQNSPPLHLYKSINY